MVRNFGLCLSHGLERLSCAAYQLKVQDRTSESGRLHEIRAVSILPTLTMWFKEDGADVG